MISEKVNETFWKSVTVPINKNVTLKLEKGSIVIKKKNN